MILFSHDLKIIKLLATEILGGVELVLDFLFHSGQAVNFFDQALHSVSIIVFALKAPGPIPG